MAAPLLEIDHLSVSFRADRGRIPVLDDISLTVGVGETVGIVGESGSGKSMLASSIVRLLPRAAAVDSGSIVLDGVDLLRLRQKQLNAVRGGAIGSVFQDPVASLNPMRRIGAQVVEVLMRHTQLSRDDASKRAVELLEEVHLPKAAERMRAYPHELSGGMCQRVTIAMAIACGPKLIIADEPTTALDATIEAQVLALLRELKAEHEMAMLLISHDMRVVAQVADRVAVMYAGEIVEQAPAAQLFSSPEHPYTEALLEAVPRVDDEDARRRRLVAIPGSPPRLGQWPPNCRFAPRCPYAGDECGESHPQLREIAPGHWVRTAHPRRVRTNADRLARV
jgi:oligopeptide/dipeptide ABC transporter ATP-binding protein